MACPRAREVWTADPERKTMKVHRPNEAVRSLTVEDVLDGGEVVPGFRLNVAEVFQP